MKLYLFSILFPVLLYPASSALFRLKRSTNSNEIIYEVNHKACFPNAKNPIHPYWIMHTKAGVKEELTGTERSKVYGVEIKSVNQEEVVFSLKAVPDRTITAKCIAQKPAAKTLLNGKNAILKSVFVKTAEKGLIPKVESISLQGYDPETYERVEEKILK